MKHWAQAAIEMVEDAGDAVLVTLCQASGSTPRGAGAKMLVTRDRQSGSIGGGNLEYQALNQARRLLETGDRRTLLQDYPLGPLLGQCCGGTVRLLLERVDDNSLAWLQAVERAAMAGEPMQLVTALDGSSPAKELVPGGRTLSPIVLMGDGKLPLHERRPKTRDCKYLGEAIGPRLPPLYLFGAGHVGRALAPIAAGLDFPVVWIDSRADAFPCPVAANIEQRLRDDPVGEVALMPPGAMAVIFTHSHGLDYALAAAVLARGDALYCGMIGSATKKARFMKRLAQDRLDPAAIDRLICPIGAKGPTGKHPGVIAVATAAELIEVARQTAGWEE